MSDACMKSPTVKMFPLNYPFTELIGILASTLQMSTELDYNTPTCRITRELQCKSTKSEISLILEFKT